jgi:hypothetical protein
MRFKAVRSAWGASAAGALLVLVGTAWAQPSSLERRQAEKCAHYKQAYAEATARHGTQGIGAEFAARHDAFLASGCSSPEPVCAKSPQEIRLANTLIVLGMNHGMASTFFPFRCRN